MECHVGADKLSQFFKLLRIDTHVGTSPSALRQQLNRMESVLPSFQLDSRKFSRLYDEIISPQVA